MDKFIKLFFPRYRRGFEDGKNAIINELCVLAWQENNPLGTGMYHEPTPELQELFDRGIINIVKKYG